MALDICIFTYTRRRFMEKINFIPAIPVVLIFNPQFERKLSVQMQKGFSEFRISGGLKEG